MQAIETKLKGCYILEPTIFPDARGYFFESFNQSKFEQAVGNSQPFVQDNQSYSTRGVLRGLHAQSGAYAQAKLVRVLEGEVLDVAVDIRPNSASFGQYVSVVLSAENKKQLYIPRGFLHGFVVLSETASFFYKCDNSYHKESEIGVHYKDKVLNIDWQIPEEELSISAKDEILPSFTELKAQLTNEK